VCFLFQAIGEQSRVQSETEYRRREQARLQANLLEIKAQSHRYVAALSKPPKTIEPT